MQGHPPFGLCESIGQGGLVSPLAHVVRLARGSQAAIRCQFTGLHETAFDFNDDAIPFGIAYFKNVVEARLPF